MAEEQKKKAEKMEENEIGRNTQHERATNKELDSASSKQSKLTEKEEKTTKKPSTKAKKKAKRRLVQDGKVYIQATYNNTIVTVTDNKGEVLAWSSAGSNGFKGAKKATPYAAQISAENAVNKAKVFGIERVHVIIKGVGSGREQAIRGIHTAGLNIESISDVTTIAHNGCRSRKARRV